MYKNDLDRIERVLRRVRQRIFDYTPDKQDQASRIIRKLKKLGEPFWKDRAWKNQIARTNRIMDTYT